MLKKVSVNFPELEVVISHDFQPGANLIEERNGYGKTTLLNTILSLHTGKFGTKAIPTGSASILTDEKEYLLSKGLWVGRDTPVNTVARYIMPGTFFDLKTPDQRLAIVDLLKIDKPAFMKERVKDWTDELKKELNAKIKFNSGKVDEILEDVVRLKAAVLAYEKSPVVDRDNSNEIEAAYRKSVEDYETKREHALKENNRITMADNENAREIANVERRLQELRTEYESVVAKPVCSSCGQDLKDVKSSLNAIVAKADVEKAKLELLKKHVSEMKFDVPAQLPYLTIEEKAVKVGIVLDVTTESEKQLKRDYDTAKRDLEDKQRKLKELGEVKDKETVEKIEKAEREFTSYLATQVSKLGLEIELFKLQKNGESVESFVISENGVPYSELSNGRKLVVQFKLSAAFADELGIDFLLLDEAGTISSESLAEIMLAANGKQVVIVRAKPFTKKDLKQDG